MFLVRDFSWQRGVDRFGPEGPRIHISELPCGFAYTTPYLLRRTYPSVRRPILLRHPFTSQRLTIHSAAGGSLRRARHEPEEVERASVVAEYERHGHRLRFSASA